MANYNIVIVGGSFAGMSIAHYLLRHTIPKLEASNSGKTYKVTLVSATDRFFFKVASPRTVTSPNLIPIKKALLPVADGFKEYSNEKLELLIATASSVDEKSKTVVVNASNGSKDLPYDSLVVSTGSRTNSPLWTLQDTSQETEDELKKVNAALVKANTVLVAGGG